MPDYQVTMTVMIVAEDDDDAEKLRRELAREGNKIGHTTRSVVLPMSLGSDFAYPED